MSSRIRMLWRTGLILFGLAGLTACEGRDLDEQQAREWLPTAVPSLKRVVILLRTCQPRRPSGYNTIWASGENGGAEPAHCTFGSDVGLSEMRAALREARAIRVVYSPSGSRTRPVESATFMLFREGLSVAGSMTSVQYYAQPQPCSPEDEEDGDIRISVRPITAAPCHWFWQYEEN